MKRREFCLHTCQAASLLAVGSLIEACSGGPTSPSNVASLITINAAVSGHTVTVAIGSSSPLATVGGAALVQAGTNPFLVVRTAQDVFVVMTAVCTHEGCTITDFGSATFVCPCHGSEFSTSGGVVRGPAASSLITFATQFANNVLTFTV